MPQTNKNPKLQSCGGILPALTISMAKTTMPKGTQKEKNKVEYPHMPTLGLVSVSQQQLALGVGLNHHEALYYAVLLCHCAFFYIQNNIELQQIDQSVIVHIWEGSLAFQHYNLKGQRCSALLTLNLWTTYCHLTN